MYHDLTLALPDIYKKELQQFERYVDYGRVGKIDDGQLLHYCGYLLTHPWIIHENLYCDKPDANNELQGLEIQLRYHLVTMLEALADRSGWSRESLIKTFVSARLDKIVDELLSRADLTPCQVDGYRATEHLTLLANYKEFYLQLGEKDYQRYLLTNRVWFRLDEMDCWKPIIIRGLMGEFGHSDFPLSNNLSIRHRIAAFLNDRFNRNERVYTACLMSDMSTVKEFTLNDPVDFLANRSDATTDMSWFIDHQVATLAVGERVYSDYHVIKRVK